jgi:hypothetical protein
VAGPGDGSTPRKRGFLGKLGLQNDGAAHRGEKAP